MLYRVKSLPGVSMEVRPLRRGERSIATYLASVSSCWKPATFPQEHTMCVLDTDDHYLALFGEWMYDPYVIQMPDTDFELWNPGVAFCSQLAIAFCEESGRVLRAVVINNTTIPTQIFTTDLRFMRLREFEILKHNECTVENALRTAGILGDV